MHVYLTGCFDVLTVKFYLKRRVGYYVIRIYFPCTLCTVISWMAFWMDCWNIGDRGTVGITSLLTQLFLVGSINESMPHVSYVKAADLFLIVSFVFSFFALLESLIVFKAASREKSTNKVLPLEEKVRTYYFPFVFQLNVQWPYIWPHKRWHIHKLSKLFGPSISPKWNLSDASFYQKEFYFKLSSISSLSSVIVWVWVVFKATVV